MATTMSSFTITGVRCRSFTGLPSGSRIQVIKHLVGLALAVVQRLVLVGVAPAANKYHAGESITVG